MAILTVREPTTGTELNDRTAGYGINATLGKPNSARKLSKMCCGSRNFDKSITLIQLIYIRPHSPYQCKKRNKDKRHLHLPKKGENN